MRRHERRRHLLRIESVFNTLRTASIWARFFSTAAAAAARAPRRDVMPFRRRMDFTCLGRSAKCRASFTVALDSAACGPRRRASTATRVMVTSPSADASAETR